MSTARKWAPWLLLAVIAAVGLTFGLNRHSSPPTLQAQVMHIAGQVRCPVCNGETAAQSQVSQSVEIRAIIQADLQKGESSNQILNSLVASYGPGILESPSAKGIGFFVWAVPVAGFLVAAGAMAWMFRRWRRAPDAPVGSDGTSGEEPVVAAPAGQAAGDRAVEPGRSSEGAVATGEAAGTVGAGVVAGVRPTGVVAGTRPTRRHLPGGRGAKIALTCAGVVMIAGGASWAVAGSAGARLPGEEITGQALGAEQIEADLNTANADTQKNDAAGAIEEFQKVLAAQPNQLEALTGEGWLLVQTGQPALVQNGLSMLQKAEATDVTYAPAHVYRGIGLVAEGDYGDSIPELQWYLDHKPDATLVPSVKRELAQAEAQVAAAKKASG
ncbi:MAG TPA: cytochrome c-type biogenesis protein CcmH [Acidimicrobiales bacterium]|nr:cytochrome c-type biogenesis protein CcmH [Acidimicrobiales bacterium]